MKKNLLQFFCIIPLLAFGDGGSITSNRYNTSLAGGVGSSGGISTSYGQLYLSTSDPINFDLADMWIAIPFNAFSPSYNVDGSTSSPATIMVLKTGVYQMNINLYFSSQESPEGSFNQTTYTIGTSTNGDTTVPCAAVYASEPGYFSLNYTVIGEFSANDYIQFYIKSSSLGGDIMFDNVVTLVQGNANLVQIAE